MKEYDEKSMITASKIVSIIVICSLVSLLIGFLFGLYNL